jgi:hypothetical protein
VLLEQQRKVLSLVEENRFEEKNRLLANVANLPWPPVVEPTIDFVRELNERREAGLRDKPRSDDAARGDSGDDLSGGEED